MRYRLSSGLWGLFLVAIGFIVAGNALGIFDISLFFKGWWTLFIIIPCGISMISNGFGNFSTIGFVVGILLLLNSQGIIIDGTIRKLLIPIILVLIGLNIIIRNMFMSIDKVKTEIPAECNYAATFGSKYVQFSNQKFYGAEINSIFGGVRVDLRDAIIDEDVVIQATAVFGGIDIYVPQNVKVKVNSTSFFGGISRKQRRGADFSGPTIYLNGTCMFGGVEIK